MILPYRCTLHYSTPSLFRQDRVPGMAHEGDYLHDDTNWMMPWCNNSPRDIVPSNGIWGIKDHHDGKYCLAIAIKLLQNVLEEMYMV